MPDWKAGYHPRAVLLVQAFERPIRRASVAGVVAGIVAGAVVMYGLVAVPWPIAAVAAIGATAGLGLAVALVLVPTRERRAYEAYSWLGAREVDRFRDRTGSTTPVNAAQVAAWLAANPPGPVTREARIEMLLSVGRVDEAKVELAALGPGTTDVERLDVAGLRAFAEIVETGSYDAAALEAALATMPDGSDLAIEAGAVRAATMSRSRLAMGQQDPLGPLVAVRASLPGAFVVTVRRSWGPFVRSLVFFGIAIALLGYILRGGLYGFFG